MFTQERENKEGMEKNKIPFYLMLNQEQQFAKMY
jgi:hypothetical protein